jgi:hypothetical protein
VSLQIAGLSKGLITQLAPVGLLSAVYQLMPLQAASICKRFFARVASMGLIFSFSLRFLASVALTTRVRHLSNLHSLLKKVKEGYQNSFIKFLRTAIC